MARWTFDPGAEADFAVPGPELYFVEAGAISLVRKDTTPKMDGGSGTPAEGAATPTTGEVLRAGDQAAVPTGAEHSLRNDGADPAKVINIVIFPASLAIPSWLPDPEAPSGVRIENLAADVISEQGDFPKDNAEIVLARTTLPAGTSQRLPQSVAYGLLVVESGAVELADASSSGGETHIGAREVARFEGGLQKIVRNTGDDLATFWVLTITAGEGTAATPAAATPVSG
jgi:mannose-6-phosphate isomerase-like protein (cupin superfamily)